MTKAGPLTIETPTDREVVLSRTFAAPPRLVFAALTEPDILRRWCLPTGWSMEVCEVDLRVGGRWRFVSRQPGGKVIGQVGVYREVVPGARLVNTESWEDWDAGETLVTTVLTEHPGGATRFTSTLLFPSKEVRDTVLRSGLEKSVGPVYEQLAHVLAEVEQGVRA